MPRQHGGAIRAVTRSVEGGNIEFELISVARETFHGTIDDERPDLLRLDAESIGFLGNNARRVDPEVLDTQAAVAFQPYNPFLRGLPAANHDGELLKKLGELMAPAAGDPAQPESNLPAAYTYLGQFIAHDVSRMVICQDGEGFNFRTPRLDLDSLFGAIDAAVHDPAKSVKFRGDMGLGLTAGGAYNRQDLPRAVSGEAQIADARNDSNLALAQFTVMMTRFYWKMLACRGNAGDARRATKHHFQHVVLDDYLRKLIDPDVFTDVVDNGGTKIVARTPFLVPLEFALAAFRVGHSMVRDHYGSFSGSLPADLPDLLGNTFLGKQLGYGPSGEHRLLNSWVVNWGGLIDLPNSAPSPAMAIDELMSIGLGKIPPWLFLQIVNCDGTTRDRSTVPEGTFVHLPVQTLLRGRLACLPDAQTLHAEINRLLPATAQLPPLRRADEIAAVTSPDLKDFLTVAGAAFADSTPLWFYCLRESALPPASGNRFGPLTSRIVMETIYAAIAEDPDGILAPSNARERFIPDKRIATENGYFGLRELVRFAMTV